jgi:GT2 family glycosyltransferase
MAKVVIIQQVYKSRRFIPQVYDAIMAQTYKDVLVVTQIVDDEGESRQYIQEHYPSVIIKDPGYNIGFAKGHNTLFDEYKDAEFFQLVNPDLILDPNYIEEMLKVFADPSVGAATGKLLKYNFDTNQPTTIIDTTGVTFSRTGRGRDRGQHEEDTGQYDEKTDLVGVSGAGPMYRRSALEAVKYNGQYFDEDFHSYWEDVDLSLRMTRLGFKNKFVPKAIGYHGRTAGSTKHGYKRVLKYVKFHAKISPWVRQLNYKNHIFLFIKNSPRWYWKFFAREFFMLGYILVFEWSTLKVIPTLWKQLPGMWQKRKWIQKHSKISNAEFEKLLV